MREMFRGRNQGIRDKRSTHRRHLHITALVIAVLLVAAACGDDDQGTDSTDGGSTSTTAAGGATLVFGTSADPILLDGAVASDGESLRALSQMFEGLVGLVPGGTEVRPLLATSWSANEDGTMWTFVLREGVKFHDGEPFNAAAVCNNFERWYNFTGSFQSDTATYYWQTIFGGFADGGGPDFSLYGGCEAVSDGEVVITLTEPNSSFLSALALPAFAIASPKALREYGADEGVEGDDGVFRATGSYGTEHPTGTGPFRFVEWNRGERLVMERNQDYWGEIPGNIGTLIFRPIGNAAAGLQALQAGDIQGYDLVDPADYDTIRGDASLQLIERPAFNVGWVGIAQGNEPMQDIEVRRAVAHALNRQAVVDGLYGGNGEVAKEFMPPSLFGYADDVTVYDYDPQESIRILTEAGYELPVKVVLGYPTDVSRPYMADPRAIAEAFAADLNEAGFEVELRSAPWSPDYVGLSGDGAYALYLRGWTGDYGDPDNFLGSQFGSPDRPRWGFNEPPIHDILSRAVREADFDERVRLYQEANRMIMDFLPGVPYVHSKPALAFVAGVTGYQPSPISIEPFSSVTLGS